MTKTILVIEDDKSVVLMLEDVLRSEGFNVLVERDGEFGLRTFQEKSVDLIIVDVLIPKIKGFDLITRLRESERGKSLPIIVISGVYRAQNHKERIVQKHRVVEYLDKPVDIDKLIDTLHDVFSSAYPVPEFAASPGVEPSVSASASAHNAKAFAAQAAVARARASASHAASDLSLGAHPGGPQYGGAAAYGANPNAAGGHGANPNALPGASQYGANPNALPGAPQFGGAAAYGANPSGAGHGANPNAAGAYGANPSGAAAYGANPSGAGHGANPNAAGGYGANPNAAGAPQFGGAAAYGANPSAAGAYGANPNAGAYGANPSAGAPPYSNVPGAAAAGAALLSSLSITAPGSPKTNAPIVPLARKDSIPSEPPKLAVPDRGTLEEVPFARLLGNLFAARSTGQLLLKKGSVKKIVYLRQGIPVFVKSNLVTECLGQVMVAEKLISEDECRRSLEKKKLSGKRQGEVLVEMGSISPHNLEFALELQLQTKLYDMFSWMEGEYQFVPKDDFAGQAVALSLGPTAMIYEGASRTMSAERIERDLERIHELAVVAAKDPTFRYQALELDPRAERLLDRIDGQRSVKKLLESADFDIEDAALLMYALSCTGLLQVTGSGGEPIELDADDVQMLSTNEINAAQELAKLPAPIAAQGLFDEATPANEGAMQLDARAFAPPITDAPLSPTAAALDAADWSGAATEPPPPPPAPPPPQATPLPAVVLTATGTPMMSDEIRRQVRARLDADAAKMISQRPQQAAPIPSSAPKKTPSTPKNPPKKEAPKLDLERDHARTKNELTDTLDRLMRADLYEVLSISRRASLEDLKLAHAKLTKDHHPDRVLAGSLSRELRSIAERIVVTIERAFETLSDPQARKSYDRSIGIENGEARIAALITAEHAFTRGKEALDKNELMTAREAFFEATEKSPQEGTYFAYLGLSMFLIAPKDDNTKNLALEALDKALELAPLNEEVYLFRGTIQQKTGNRTEAVREFERALRCNPDSVPALEALKILEPPQQKKAGFLSRLTSS